MATTALRAIDDARRRVELEEEELRLSGGLQPPVRTVAPQPTAPPSTIQPVAPVTSQPSMTALAPQTTTRSPVDPRALVAPDGYRSTGGTSLPTTPPRTAQPRPSVTTPAPAPSTPPSGGGFQPIATDIPPGMGTPTPSPGAGTAGGSVGPGAVPEPVRPAVPEPSAMVAPTPAVPPAGPEQPSADMQALLALIQQMMNQQPEAAPDLPFTSYSPESDLRGTQINPVASPRLAGTRGMVDQQAGQVAGSELSPFEGVAATGRDLGEFAEIAPGSFAESAEAQRARELGVGNLEAMNAAPDRLALVERAIQLAREQSQPGFDQDIRQIGQGAAAFGRLGSGVTTTRLGDLGDLREQGFQQLREGLTIDALDKSLSDRGTLLNSALRAGGQFRGEDLATAGFQQGLRGEARDERGLQRGAEFDAIEMARRNRDEQRGERDSRTGFELAELGAERGVLGDLAGLEASQFGQGAAERNELRGERDFQNSMQQQALMDFVRQTQLQEDVASSQQGRSNSTLALLLNAALGGGDPSQALMAGSGQLSDDANSATSALMNLLLQYGQRSAA